MRISVKGEYAMQALFDLSTRDSGDPIRIADIARRQKIPQKFLELILASLKQAGFVESRRGAEGGYRMARSPATITVGEVLRFIEGAEHKSRGRRRADTPFSEMWRSVDDAISAILDHTNFAELSRRWAERQRQYVPDWEI
jgi:Rrf2 family protein